MRRLIPMLLLVSSACAQNAGKPVSLKVVTPARLVDCAPVTTVPCMSMSLTAVDATGKPAPMTLAPGKPLTQSLSAVSGEGTETVPFYATSGNGLDSGQHRNVVLLEIDISGSMRQPAPGSPSRFAAVKTAVGHYLDSMQEGSDEIAIVPFESHNVVSTIRSAVFSTHKAELMAQLDALPEPGPKNNTALYQAVYTGVDTMKAQLSTLEHQGLRMSDVQSHLIVMTDGTNEVLAGDDPYLLNGPLGLQQAAAQVASSGIDVIGVGFGDRTAIDSVALSRLSKRFFYATDANELLNALHVTRTAQSHVIEMTWLMTVANRIALTGRDQVWTPLLTLEDGTVLRGEPQRTVVPAMTPPLFARVSIPAELAALIAMHPPPTAGWTVLVVHLVLFVVVAALLLLLWFWVPRLVWQGRELVPAPVRWSAEKPSLTVASGVQIRKSPLPPGFAAAQETRSPLQRSAAQTTQVGPKSDAARNRLNFE